MPSAGRALLLAISLPAWCPAASAPHDPALSHLRRALAEGDVDGDGMLSGAEFEALAAMGHRDLLNAAFEALDRDDDGRLDSEPFQREGGAMERSGNQQLAQIPNAGDDPRMWQLSILSAMGGDKWETQAPMVQSAPTHKMTFAEVIYNIFVFCVKDFILANEQLKGDLWKHYTGHKMSVFGELYVPGEGLKKDMALTDLTFPDTDALRQNLATLAVGAGNQFATGHSVAESMRAFLAVANRGVLVGWDPATPLTLPTEMWEHITKFLTPAAGMFKKGNSFLIRLRAKHLILKDGEVSKEKDSARLEHMYKITNLGRDD